MEMFTQIGRILRNAFEKSSRWMEINLYCIIYNKGDGSTDNQSIRDAYIYIYILLSTDCLSIY